MRSSPSACWATGCTRCWCATRRPSTSFGAGTSRPGPVVLLPCVPGPRLAADGHALQDELRVDGPAAAWVRALLAGHEVLDGGAGRALRRANGAVFLDGGPTSG